MNKQKNISSFETACWFYQKAQADKIRITDSKIQHLLFLSQLHYALKHGSYLMPTLFVCFDRGFYEASVQNILPYGIPPISFTDMAHTDFLELIWQKYGHIKYNQGSYIAKRSGKSIRMDPSQTNRPKKIRSTLCQNFYTYC